MQGTLAVIDRNNSRYLIMLESHLTFFRPKRYKRKEDKKFAVFLQIIKGFLHTGFGSYYL